MASSSFSVPFDVFVVDLLLSGFLSLVLALVYVRFGSALSNRRMFSRNFLLISMTTMFIITVVKSSLTLSLGLVGALSIVRFRTAVKEPEELAFLFLTIGIGLGLGAGQRLITVVTLVVVCLLFILRRVLFLRGGGRSGQNLHLTVSGKVSGKVGLDAVVVLLEKRCSFVSLKRFDEGEGFFEVSFLVGFDNFKELEKLRADLLGLSRSIKITFIDY